MVHLDSIVPQTVSIRGTLSRSPLPRPDAPVSAVRLKQTGGGLDQTPPCSSGQVLGSFRSQVGVVPVVIQHAGQVAILPYCQHARGSPMGLCDAHAPGREVPWKWAKESATWNRSLAGLPYSPVGLGAERAVSPEAQRR